MQSQPGLVPPYVFAALQQLLAAGIFRLVPCPLQFFVVFGAVLVVRLVVALPFLLLDLFDLLLRHLMRV